MRKPIFIHRLLAIPFVSAFLALAAYAFAQQPPPSAAPAERLSFEVASIKPAKPDIGSVYSYGPDGFRATNVSIESLFEKAYGVQPFQVAGMPGWMRSERYDIEAKLDKELGDKLQKMNPTQGGPERQQLLQSLLADRFQLKVHRETKDGPIYELVVAKGGSKLHSEKAAVGVGMGPGMIDSKGMDLAGLAGMLSGALDRPVVDKTGLAGPYSFTLKWAPDPGQAPPPGGSGSATEDSGPSLFTALEEQLGLKLESAKGPVESLVIDQIERPSAN
jgi:uncharacterized protein (TIGR03435 family)